MELEEAIQTLKDFAKYGRYYSNNTEHHMKTAINIVLNYLTKQEKMNDRMAKALHLFIWKNDEKIMITSRPKVSCHTLSIEEIKQYFEKKVEGTNNE